MTEHKLGPLGGVTTGKLRLEGQTLVYSRPGVEERRVPVGQVRMVEINRPSRWSAHSRRRTITIHGPGGPLLVLEAIGKLGDAAYEWLETLTGPAS